MPQTVKIKCNGYSSNRVRFVGRGLVLFNRLVNELRDVYTREMEKTDGVYFGRRFADNDSVLMRIESAVSEDDFLTAPKEWVWAGLEECARSDHWYEFEKNWE